MPFGRPPPDKLVPLADEVDVRARVATDAAGMVVLDTVDLDEELGISNALGRSSLGRVRIPEAQLEKGRSGHFCRSQSLYTRNLSVPLAPDKVTVRMPLGVSPGTRSRIA